MPLELSRGHRVLLRPRIELRHCRIGGAGPAGNDGLDQGVEPIVPLDTEAGCTRVAPQLAATSGDRFTASKYRRCLARLGVLPGAFRRLTASSGRQGCSVGGHGGACRRVAALDARPMKLVGVVRYARVG